MAIDASIYGQQQPTPFNNPFKSLMEAREQQQRRQLVDQQIRSGQATEEQHRLAIADKIKTEAEQSALAEILSNPTISQEDAKKQIAARAPGLYQSFAKAADEHAEKASQIAQNIASAASSMSKAHQNAQEFVANDAADTLAKPTPLHAGILNQKLQTYERLFPESKAQFEQMRQQIAEGADPTQMLQGLQQASTAQRGANTAAARQTAEQPGQEAESQTRQQVLAGMRGGITAQQAHQAAEEARHNRVTESRAAESEPLVAVMGPNGKPTLVKRTDALGKTPASNREQGRQVTSGDAGRVADINTSLDNLDTLEKEIGKTGTGSYLGSKVPNFVTDAIGLGAESKSRQGVINRVKQMIGNALEGGVLRKEDETKYERILPTIGDAPDVAKAKLSGLRELLTQKKQNVIDALKDANYDVTDFEKRAETKKPTAADLIKKYGG